VLPAGAAAGAGTGSAVAGIGAGGGGGSAGGAGAAGPVPGGGTMTPSIVRSLLLPPASKSNPQDSQNRPVLAAPQCGQGSAAAGCCASGCCASGCCGAGCCGAGCCRASGSCGWTLAAAPILIPHTSQKSLLADV
jgi:hypothetical protein